jgi:hypothetical protein
MPKTKLDLNELARGLGAERRGRVVAGAGYFAAAQLAADIAQRLRVPPHGGRATDPGWTERRAVPLSRQTLDHLAAWADRLGVEPMQLAALLIEKGLDTAGEDLRLSTGRPRQGADAGRAPSRGRVPAK